MVTSNFKFHATEALVRNFDFVQDKIVQIIDAEDRHRIDIKQISDLDKFVTMQKNIISTIETVNEL